MDHPSDEFTPSQIKILEHFVTTTSGNVFALRNLPEVIKGALFSRYSRSSLGLKSLLLKDFILNEESAFSSIVDAQKSASEDEQEGQMIAIKKAQNFYDRILDGYGDDSIGELGGAHLALENISMIAAKEIEDCRIGGSPLEKSTRYVYFDQKVDGEYLFYKEPVLMTSAYRDLYLTTCNRLFDTYSQLIPPLTEVMEKKFPKEPEVSKIAYTAAIRAKVLDCLRGLLPAGCLTNMGVYGNGRFFESLIQKLNCHNLGEMRMLGESSFRELSKVVPSFIRRAQPSHRHQKTYSEFKEAIQSELKNLTSRCDQNLGRMENAGVKLINYDPDSPVRVGAALLFAHSNYGLLEAQNYCSCLSEEDLGRILEAGCTYRQNRRHKSPRALEHAEFTFEIVGDYGIYRDLQRHRMLTQEKQLLGCDLGYYVPSEIKGTEMEKAYVDALNEARKTYDLISKEFKEEAQYVVPMAYNIHWYFHINLRALQWLCELRSAPAGHPSYRYVAQELATQVIKVFPQFERFFKFVDYEGYELGRLGQEMRIDEKKRARALT